MSFLKRAYLAVKRRKARTCIMLVILTAISALIFTGLAVQNATKEASILARQKLGSTITLTFDSEKARQKQSEEAQGEGQNRKVMTNIEYEAVSEEMVEKIARNEHIYDYNYIVNSTAFAESFDAITDSQGEEMKEAENDMKDKISNFNSSMDDFVGGRKPDGLGKIDMANIVMPDISLVGVSASDLDANFEAGSYSMVDGETITPSSAENAVIIEQTLAEANEISIGDNITIKATSDGEEINLNVIGIYSAGEIEQGSMLSGMSSSLIYNKIYMRHDKAVSIKEIAASEKENSDNSPMVRGETNSSNGIDSAIFYVDDPENIDEVIEYAKDTQLDLETYKLSANDEEYESMIKPIENVASFSKILVIIVIVAGAMIIALILMLWIKERTYETGVLLSLGESKAKVVLQYVSEVIAIFIVGFVLSVLIGTGVSQKVGDVLLSQEIEAIQGEDVNNLSQMDDRNISRQPVGGKSFDRKTNMMVETKVIDKIDVNVSLLVIIQVFGLGLLLIFISTVIPVIYVFRYNPKQILTNVG